jgi:small-conductance mechanosensitive channel
MRHLQTLFDNNSLSHFLVAFSTAFVIFAVLIGLRYLMSTQIRRITNRNHALWGNILVEVMASTKILILLIFSLLLGLLALEISNETQRILIHTAIAVFLFQLGLSLSKGISLWVTYRMGNQQKTEGTPDNHNYAIISFVLRLTVWIVIFLLVLDNLGIDVRTLIASLGIGGIAVALAVQNILGDLFASLSIALDKPFLVGDFIVIDKLSGTVRHIGLKTTRITSITGEELVISNADLLKSRIHNYKKMEARRIEFTLNITFDTPAEKLQRIPDIIQEVFRPVQTVRLDRVHFSRIGQSSLDFEIVYYVNVADYYVYVEAQQAINLAIMECFTKENIGFAFPTQTLYINKER